MEQLTGGKQGAASESPDSEGEGSERRRGWYVAAVGYVLTVAAFLGWLGTELLPSSTFVEKSLIIAACLVLGLASLVGYGAWRSAWRFAVTVLALVLAVFCMSALAVVAGDTVSSSTHVAGTATASSAAASPQSPSLGGTPVYLADLAGNPDDTSPPDPGTWTLAGHTYPHSIGYAAGDAGLYEATVTYSLHGYNWFQAEAGINDEPGSGAGWVEFIVYSNTGGNLHEIYDRKAQWGNPVPIHLSIVGATQLELETDVYLDGSNPEAVWGNAALLP